MFDKIKNKISDNKIFIEPTLFFILCALFISIPIFYFTLDITVGFIYIILSYFIIIIALSTSYYRYFKEEWKTKISGKLIVIYIIIYQLISIIVFNYFNILIGIDIIVLGSIFLAILINLIFFFFDYIIATPSFQFTKWIFKSFDGKLLTLQKNIDNKNDFKVLTELLARGTIPYFKGDSVMIQDSTLYRTPTFFLKYKKDIGVVELQIGQQKWISFGINEKTKNYENVLKSLGFESLGETELNNEFYIRKNSYPIFAKTKNLGNLWLFIGIISIILAKMKYERDYFYVDYFSLEITRLYYIINEIAKNNPILIFILGIVLTLIFANFEKIKSNFREWFESLKEL